MQLDHNSVPLAALTSLFSNLLVVGMALTLPLYKFDWKRFVRSSVFIKILFWIPIFLLFLAVLYLSNSGRLIVLGGLIILAKSEFFLVWRRTRKTIILGLYAPAFYLAMGHFILLGAVYPEQFINILITLAFASVLGDVAAFFLGNYFGKHKLPAVLNRNKSWEGVFGEVAGALAGVLLVNAFIMPIISIWLFLPIGVGCALGDLTNSFINRKLDIKDWSRAIPGHGGFIDRLSSLVGSALLTFYYLKLTI